jgi:hypothetical protein
MATPRVEASQVQLPEVNVSQVHTSQVNPPQAATLPSNTLLTNATPTELNALAIPTPPVDVTPLPAEQVANNGASDGRSYTLTLPNVFDIETDSSAPPATGLWMIIDHFTGEVIVNNNQSTPPTCYDLGLFFEPSATLVYSDTLDFIQTTKP